MDERASSLVASVERDAVDGELQALVSEAWRQHSAARGKPWLVTPSAPVLYFGNLDSFRRSALRVVTVGLNPSNREFPPAAPDLRFPGVIEARRPAAASYVRALNEYFEVEPYRSWFGSYEEMLAGLDSSYYAGRTSTALHTDIGSCLPTEPTWGGLAENVRARLAGDGVALWRLLIEYLHPHIVVCSIARRWLSLIALAPRGAWAPLVTFGATANGAERSRPVTVEGRWYAAGEAPVLVAFVPAAQVPLGTLSHPQKREAGTAIGRRWNAGV